MEGLANSQASSMQIGRKYVSEDSGADSPTLSLPDNGSIETH
jgi:hypothetical protein